MMRVQHPTIIKFIGYSFQDPSGLNNVTLILELAKRGSLSELLKKAEKGLAESDYDNTARQIILVGIARGMMLLHQKNVIHRDLKPDNILLDENLYPHITDFGLSKMYDSNNSMNQSQSCGTSYYMAPEVIASNHYNGKDNDSPYIFAIQKDNSKIELINNQFKIDDSVTSTYIFGYTLTQFQGWTLDNNCMKPLNVELIFGEQTDANKPVIEKFIECPIMECPPVPDPNSDLYVNDCDNTYDESSHIIKDTLVTFFYCTFNNIQNWDQGLGGAIYIFTSSNIQKDIKLPFKIYNCEFNTCSSKKGGAIAIESTEDSRPFEIKDCEFTGNECRFDKSDYNSDESFGGALYINAKSSIVLISASTFSANKAGNGGAIYYITDSAISSKLLESETGEDCSLKVTGCTFKSNEGYNEGGAIHISLLNGEPPKPIEISSCSFKLNMADESDGTWNDPQVLPESGGAIFFVYNPSSGPSSSFKFLVKSCKFNDNVCSHCGGAICLLIINKEPLAPIEINNCNFNQNRAYGNMESSEIEGYGSDIYYSLNASAAAPAPSKILLDTNPSLNVIDCEFSNGNAVTKGGSFYFTVQDVQTARPIEVTKCRFKDATSEKGEAINILSNRPDILFHFSQCEFSGKCSIHFNAVSGHFDFCTFDNIVESYPIKYDCNPDISPSADPSFKIEHSTFVQSNEITSLVFFVPKDQSNFAFLHNSIKITNKVTCVFDCPADAQNLGKWVFENNTISPRNEEFLKTENAKRIDFEASCQNGFDCIPSFCVGDYRCYLNGDEYGISLVLIINTKFNGMTYQTNGGAVELINYGVICNTTEFNACKSNEAGGAIYIHVDSELNDPIHFKDVKFISNEAVYGGALYIYSSVKENVIEIFTCTFNQNVASSDKTSDEKYGGSAIYMSALNSKIARCKFSQNVGNSVKFYTNFQNSLLSINDELSSSISVDNCVFEMDEKSSSSIYYVHSNKKEVVVNLKDCLFKGNLAKNAHHIDGISLQNKVDVPKIKIESCKFSSNKKLSLNLNSNLIAFDTKISQFNFDDSLKNEQQKVNGYNWNLISVLAITVVGFVAIIAALAVKQHNNNNNQEESNEETAEL